MRSNSPTRMQNGIASSLALPRNDEANVAHVSIAETALMTRIAVGGFLHETNTFAPTKATYDDFVHGGGWPAMTQGADVLEGDAQHQCRARRLRRRPPKPAAGNWSRPSACGASPSAHVTRDAFERIAKANGRRHRRGGRARRRLSRPARRDGHRTSRRRRRRNPRARAPGDRQRPSAGRQPRPARQRHARNGRACGRADRLSHLSACRHGRHRPRRPQDISRCC